jgi:hypothetical protein
MSLNLVNRNTSSPFHLQRSIVDQGGEGGVYESGGYTGAADYNADAVNATLTSFAETVGNALSERSPEGNNKQDVKTKERLENRSKRLNEKKTSSTNEKKVARIEKRLTNIGERKQKVETRIKTFEEEKKKKIPTATIN